MSRNDMIRGTLIPIGGNEDKGTDEYQGLDFIEEGILSRVVKESGGEDCKIVVIPTASSIPEEVGENYLDAFKKLGCTNVKVLDIRKREQADDPDFLKHVAEADCIMMSGGDQSRITDIIGGSEMHRLMQKRYVEDDIVIAGTSAGAMAMTKEMIAGGSATESMLKGAVLLYKGLGLIPQLLIDTHFIRRGRFGRMAEAVAAFPALMGIGLAEDTGLVVKEGNVFEVIGSGMVILFDPSELQHNLHSRLTLGTPMSMSHLVTHILARGDRFTLDDRNIEIMPLKGIQVVEG